MIRGLRLGAALASLALLAACGSDASGSGPTWKPAPSFQGENVVPGNPLPGDSGTAAPAPALPSATAPSSSGPQQDSIVVATKLNQPTAVAIMPDNTALVGERTTGRIVRVQATPGQPVRTVRTLTGLSTVGGGGLLDLALSPNYAQDNLIFAYITTPTDNRVVAFTLNGPVTPVLKGIPRGRTDNAGRIAFDSTGSLLVGTGDAGHPSLAADASSLAGKVLRVSDIGAAAAGNPFPGSRVLTLGHHVVAGLCVASTTHQVYETESRPTSDPINLLVAGANYGWPTSGVDYRKPIGTLPDTARAPGGCAVIDDQLYLTSLDGESLLATHLGQGSAIGKFTAALKGKYGRLRTVVAASDGALWITTSNKDGHGKPAASDDRVLRIVPQGDASNNT